MSETPGRHVCVLCGKAWEVESSKGSVEWIVSYETPTDCEHETVSQDELYRRAREESRAYRGCPFGLHAPDEDHHYSCWAEM